MCVGVMAVVPESPVHVQTPKAFRSMQGQQGVAHPGRGLEGGNAHRRAAQVSGHDLSLTAHARLFLTL